MGGRKTISEKNAQRTSVLVIVIITVIAVVVVGVGVYLATRSSGTSPSISTTPIDAATSYEFNETTTASNGTVIDTTYYAAKNLGMSNVDIIWVVTTPSNGTSERILNEAQQKVWSYEGGQWTTIWADTSSSEYTNSLLSIESAGTEYVNMLAAWSGSGIFNYTIQSGQPNTWVTATFTNIHINPSLPDSLFQPPKGALN